MTIRARIRAAIRGGQQNPALISEGILPQLTDTEIYDALKVALPYLIRDEIRKYRHDALGDRTNERSDGAARWRDPDTGEYELMPSAAEHARQRREIGQAGADASQATRDRNAALLRTPIHVPGHGHKALGDCTPTDLRAVARGMRTRAAENERRADGFDKLAIRLEEAGAPTVADLGLGEKLREQFAP